MMTGASNHAYTEADDSRDACSFTVVTPVLNGERFLEKTIASVRQQSFENFEYLIVDGGSTDGTLAIAHAAAERDSRIRIIERPGLGQYASILEGFRAARGMWLSWLNADDLYTGWALKTVSEQADDVDWVIGFPACWDEADSLRFLRPEGWRPQKLIRDGWFHSGLLGFIQQESIFFKRSLFEKLSDAERKKFSDAKLAGDYILWKLFAAHAKLETIPTVLGGFRRHGDNRSITLQQEYLDEIKRDGTIELPTPVANLARAIYLRVSSTRAAQLAHREDIKKR
ncbi:glycosyltransferase [Hyphococcus formosus]|uniref:glycosyltransferase n=1 Tax=Hyphococcus formosus TaxID=3143534 RepID=UPI00398B1A83